MVDYQKESITVHRKSRGKLEVISKLKISNKEELSLAYTPGVAGPCMEIFENPKEYENLTSNANTVAVISDGSAVLGLGNIGPKASMPVMEGKCALFKSFANVDAFPIILDTQDTEEIIKTIKNIAPSFGGINLEDISAPRCFEIEERLKEELDIPIFHDDQHGTAIVVLAGVINSLKIVGKKVGEVRVIVNGSGSAGTAIGKILINYGVKNLIFCDSKGIISKNRKNLNESKKSLLKISNQEDISGDLKKAIKGRDIFIGVSKGNILEGEDIETMAKDPIIFAMANPTPEIMPEIAKKHGAKIIATGRSDYDNQINNVLVFPGIFKGALQKRCQISDNMKITVAKALANLVKEPNHSKIIPSPFNKGISDAVAKAVIEFKE